MAVAALANLAQPVSAGGVPSKSTDKDIAKAALLTTNDLGTDWTELEASKTQPTPKTKSCKNVRNAEKLERKAAKANVSFLNNPAQVIVGEQVVVFRNNKDAKKYRAGLTAGDAASCAASVIARDIAAVYPDFPVADANVTINTGEVTGVESTIYEVTFESGARTARNVIVLIRQGRGVILLEALSIASGEETIIGPAINNLKANLTT
jgi:hypothetical protein